MRRLIVVLLLGLAVGYRWGYGDGSGGKPTVMARTLDKFGASRVRAAQEASDKRIEDASKP